VMLGMEVNLKEAGGYINFLIVLLVAIVGAKLVGSWIATRREFDSLRERALIVIGILPQGEMGMLIAAYLFSRGPVNPSSFNVTITAVVLLTMLTPVLIKIAYTEFNVQRASIPASNPPESLFSKGGLKGVLL
jgi:Kef-type K+ transport system membrane component KefB